MDSDKVGNTISQDEKLLQKLDVSDNGSTTLKTGNIYVLSLTDKRMIIELVKSGSENLGCAFSILGAIVGVGLGSLIFVLLSSIANYAGMRGTQAKFVVAVLTIAAGTGVIAFFRNIGILLGNRGKKDIVMGYNDILRVILKRKSIPIGHSMLKIEFAEGKLVLKFGRRYFDDLSQLLINLLPNKVELK